MQMRATRSVLIPALAAAVLVGPVGQTQAQTATTSKPAVNPYIFNFQTSVGSFKLEGSDETPPKGRLTINFRGSVLVSGLRPGGKITPKGNVRLEMDDKRYNKKVYFGQGQLVVEGTVRAVQFFGRDLKGRYEGGTGNFRLYGEFDKKLETGTHWFEGETERTPWGTGGPTIPVPRQDLAQAPTKVRVNPKKG